MPQNGKNAWKPIGQYADLDGIEARARNRTAFRRFVSDFGWTEYVFHPAVYDYNKFLRGDPAGERKDRNAIGFARIVDRSLDGMGGYVRAFRNGNATMVAYMDARPDMAALSEWCRRRGAVCVECHPSRAIHRNGTHGMFLLMSPATRDRYESVLDSYGAPLAGNNIDRIEGTVHVEWE